MSFSDFKTLADVQTKYGIAFREDDFVDALPVAPPAHFMEEFEYTRKYFAALSSEASRSEIVIFPILREVYKPFAEEFAFWIQHPLNAGAELNGTPDYLVTTRSDLGKTVVGVALIIVTKAKKNDFEIGWGECLAEMYAAQQINKDEAPAVYGIVTDAERWQVGRLAENIYSQHPASFRLEDVEELFGALGSVFESACGQMRQTATIRIQNTEKKS